MALALSTFKFRLSTLSTDEALLLCGLRHTSRKSKQLAAAKGKLQQVVDNVPRETQLHLESYLHDIDRLAFTLFYRMGYGQHNRWNPNEYVYDQNGRCIELFFAMREIATALWLREEQLIDDDTCNTLTLLWRIAFVGLE